jgi:tetratricopeptide (TPR) repeat protein
MLDRCQKTARTIFFLSFGLVLISLRPTLLAAPLENGSSRLQALLYGEAVFYSQQQDYFSAITRLQLADEQGMLQPSYADAGIFLARLKLAYGLDVDAAFDFHALLDDEVLDTVRNRAWYELAKAFFHKGYTEAAEEALDHIRGQVPEDIRGDYQLLHATVLIASNRNSEAAQLLEEWRGAPESAAYAHYNRGIALMRGGDYEAAIESLKRVAQRQADGEQWLALRDKSNLSLAYAFTQTGRLEQAQAQLEKVRLKGPFSNRALLALGWIAYKQGRREAALVPWMELRGRSPSDPAVLETLLIVPSVYRELDSLQVATRDYEAALATLSDELRRLNDTRESVRRGSNISLLLQKDPVSAGSPAQVEQAPTGLETRYLGRLLASRNFQQTLQGHGELRSMLRDIDEGLNSIDELARVAEPDKEGADRSTAVRPSTQPAQESGGPASGNGRGPAQGLARNSLPSDPEWAVDWEERPGQQAEQQSPGIPLLPEIELPDSSAVKPLPQSEFSGLPEPNFSGLPEEPELRALLEVPQDIGLPVSQVSWLPETGRLQLPWNDQDYAYPDAIARFEPQAAPGDRRQRMQRITTPGVDDGFYAGAEPVGEALRELAAALSSATDRMARLSQAFDAAPPGVDGLEDRITALRDRILRLRSRVKNAIALNESYTETLALDELNRRQHQLEQLLEQASLELAKTYDKAADN